MSVFDKTYLDVIRNLKREQAKQNTAESKELDNEQPLSDEPFNSCMWDLSDIDFEPLGLGLFYKKAFRKYHEYKIQPPNTPIIKRKENSFEDVEILVYQVLQLENELDQINADFLTGYYLQKQHNIASRSLKFKRISSFHAGISSDGLIRGIYYALPKNTNWSLKGCDRQFDKKYTPCYINGNRKPVDIYDKNTASSMNIQIGNIIASSSLDLMTCDVRSVTAIQVFKQYLLLYDYVAQDGTFVFRLPVNWNLIYTGMLSMLLYFISHYKIVKLFKTPWGDYPRIYLIVRHQKVKIPNSKILAIKSYIQDCTAENSADIPLFNIHTYEETDEETKDMQNKNIKSNIEYMDTFLENLSAIYTDLVSIDSKFSKDRSMSLWTKLLE